MKKRLFIIAFIILLLIIIVILLNNQAINKIISKIALKQTENENLLSISLLDNKSSENNKILININSDEGIEYVLCSNGNKIYGNERNNLSLDYEVKENEEYIIKIKEKNRDEIEKRILINEQALDDIAIKIDEIESESGTRTFSVENKSNLANYKISYKIGENGTWKEGSGNFTINNYEITDKIASEDKTILVEAKLENNGNGNVIKCSKKFELGDIIDFRYTDGEQSIELEPGRYKLEVWGAQGGNASWIKGGRGGYATGEIELTENTLIYVNVGGSGKSIYGGSIQGGYNGGGTASSWGGHYTEGSGGGATHIALISGLLKDCSENTDKILIVAGGGGGANFDDGTAMWRTEGGYGGGTTGGNTSSQRKAYRRNTNRSRI